MKSSPKGYTLIEVVLVISLIGILAAMAVPHIDRTPFDMKVYSRQLCADLRYIRLMKMTEGENYQITLYEQFYKVLNGTKELKTVKAPKNVVILYTRQHISFTSYGAPSNSDTISIRDKKSGKYYEVTIVPSSGRVLLKDEIQRSK
ncbi:prepilin-type N-terminal cleavage/methylation domain-containing protein [Geosporobacter subterraneus DSM 17957]|uniref:Prepilin-type N-terminal cleavage/methylation domain-containing protein n=1 Tax=Geosporobacter subterraneus DSM 17957 TaxID=1121919 RepID=A0A1M6C1L4_9FIRM|nr:type II secretion system protein [Geosporobacter subterraneus]SHI54906.1 prepilin-type N-terminal cleavage/methylation domain-containing protein [Geosporobacter subterraneus DSM 17957]